jgi:uncharacterized membrane protein
MASISTVNSISPAADLVAIRKIGVADVRDALSRGVDDFLAIPTQLVFLCFLYPIVGLAAARMATDGNLLPLLFPLVAGLTLLGPVLAVGIYELSRRRELGLPVSWVNAFAVLRSPSLFSIGIVGIVLFGIFIIWLGVAKIIYLVTIGPDAPASLGAFAEQILDTRAGWHLMLFGNLAGFLFAVLVLTLTVVSVPLLLDRGGSPFAALQTSVRAVRANPVMMALWGLIVAAVLLLGCLPLFIGLAIAMPVLGHATWHLYRKVVV